SYTSKAFPVTSSATRQSGPTVCRNRSQPARVLGNRECSSFCSIGSHSQTWTYRACRSSPRYRGIASSPLRPSRSAGRSWCSVRAYTCPGSRGTPRAHVGGAQEGADPNTTTSSTAHVKTRRTLLPALRCRLRPRTRSRLGQGSTELLAAWLDLNHANTTRRDTAPRQFGHRIGDVRLADDPRVVQQRNVELRRLFRPVLEPEERDNLPHGGFVLSKRDGSSIVDRGRRVGAAFAV